MKWIVLLLFGGIGLSALAGGALWGLKRYSLVQNGLPASGTVVAQEEIESFERGENPQGSTIRHIGYYPVVEFVTQAGEKIRFRGSTGGQDKPLIETGASVDVIYDPATPSNAQIGSFSQFWLGPAVLAGAGLIFALMGAGAFLLIGSQDREIEKSFELAQRQTLPMRKDTLLAHGTIARTELLKGHNDKYVFVCRAVPPDRMAEEEFLSDHFDFDPGYSFVGRQIDIYIDPANRNNYYVNIDPLLREIITGRDTTPVSR